MLAYQPCFGNFVFMLYRFVPLISLKSLTYADVPLRN